MQSPDFHSWCAFTTFCNFFLLTRFAGLGFLLDNHSGGGNRMEIQVELYQSFVLGEKFSSLVLSRLIGSLSAHKIHSNNKHFLHFAQ